MFKKIIIYSLIIYSLNHYYRFFSWYLGNEQMIIEDAFELSLQSSLPVFLVIFLTHYFYYPKNNNNHALVISFPAIILLFFINVAFFSSTANMYYGQIYKVPEYFDLFRSTAIGLVLIIISFIIFFISIKAFSTVNEDPIPTTSTEIIIFKSIYKYSRNPMYLAMLIIQIGIGMVLSMIHITFLTILTYVVLKYYVIVPEEEYLEKKFGEEYTIYKNSVRRWI